jgi:hypothetical protein
VAEVYCVVIIGYNPRRTGAGLHAQGGGLHGRGASGHGNHHGDARAWVHCRLAYFYSACRFVLPPIHCIPDLRICSTPLFLKRPSGQILGDAHRLRHRQQDHGAGDSASSAWLRARSMPAQRSTAARAAGPGGGERQGLGPDRITRRPGETEAMLKLTFSTTIQPP